MNVTESNEPGDFASAVYYLALTIFFCFLTYSMVLKVPLELSAHGVTTVGTVVDYRYWELRPNANSKSRKNPHHDHLLDYGVGKEWLNLEREYPIGSEITVRYSAREPNIVLATKEKTFWMLAVEKSGMILLILMPVVTIIAAFSAAFLAWGRSKSE